MCNDGEESILHAMVQCPFASQCWQHLFPDVQQRIDMGFEGWLENMFSSIDSNMRALVVLVCWAIWKARNDNYWHRKQQMMNVVLASAKQYLVQWQNSQGRSTQDLCHSKFVGDGASSWVKPQIDNIKVTVDAALFRDRSAFGMGMIARDCRGELIQANSKLQQEVVSPDLAEAMAMKEALS